MYASLNAVNLPFHFRYSHPELDARMNISQTCGGVVLQESANASLIQGKLLPWVMNVSTPEQYKFFYDFHQSREDREFIGYWGEVYTVRSFALPSPKIYGRNYDFSGSWVIKCVITEINPVCDYLSQVQGSPSEP